MQNSSLPPNRSDFDQASTIADEQRIALDVHRLQNARISRRFETLIAQQTADLERTRQSLEKNRPKTVKFLTQAKLDDEVRQINWSLRPKDLPAPMRSEIRERARYDATVEVMRGEESILAEKRQENLIQQQRFLDLARDMTGKGKDSFNANAEERART